MLVEYKTICANCKKKMVSNYCEGNRPATHTFCSCQCKRDFSESTEKKEQLCRSGLLQIIPKLLETPKFRDEIREYAEKKYGVEKHRVGRILGDLFTTQVLLCYPTRYTSNSVCYLHPKDREYAAQLFSSKRKEIMSALDKAVRSKIMENERAFRELRPKVKEDFKTMKIEEVCQKYSISIISAKRMIES
jgi:hypothetical protein